MLFAVFILCNIIYYVHNILFIYNLCYSLPNFITGLEYSTRKISLISLNNVNTNVNEQQMLNHFYSTNISDMSFVAQTNSKGL